MDGVNEVAVVTGTSRGIGRAIALALAHRKLDVALLGRPSPAHDATRRDCEALGVLARSYVCDLGNDEQIGGAAKALLAELGAPRVVINNAGMLIRGARIHEIAVEDWDRVMAVNLRGPFLLCRALLPAMLGKGRGRFVHLSSVAGTIGSPQAAHYGASKWGLIGLSKSLAEELRGTGLTSVAVLPGGVSTDMLAQTPFEPAMTAEDVARLVVYYALDAPDAVTGASVEILG